MREHIAAFLIVLMVATAVHHCTRTIIRPVRVPAYRETLEGY